MDSKQFGQRLRQAREQANMTQEQLAEATSRDQRAISEYEHGRRRLSAVDLPVFAKALSVSILFFFEAEVSSHDLEAELLGEFRQLPTEASKSSAIDILHLFNSSIQQHLSH